MCTSLIRYIDKMRCIQYYYKNTLQIEKWRKHYLRSLVRPMFRCCCFRAQVMRKIDFKEGNECSCSIKNFSDLFLSIVRQTVMYSIIRFEKWYGWWNFCCSQFHDGRKYKMGHLCFEWLSSVVGSRMDEATHAKKYKQKIVSKNNVYNQ